MNKSIETIFLSFLFLFFIQIIIIGQDRDRIALADSYYKEGSVDKALALYRDLAGSRLNSSLIHKNYFDILLNKALYDEAQSHLDKIIKSNTENLFYQIDQGILYKYMNKDKKLEDHMDHLVNRIAYNPSQVQMAAHYMVRNDLSDFAVKSYLKTREITGKPDMYAIDLANIYRILNRKDEMVNEFLLFAEQNPQNLSYIKRVFQVYLTEDDYPSLKQLLIDRIQKDPNNYLYNDLLVWVHIQMNDFFGAFIQARAFDKRRGAKGQIVLNLGNTARANKAYDIAEKSYQYVMDQYPKKDHSNYVIAKKSLIEVKQEIVINTYPIDSVRIKELIIAYSELKDEIGINNYVLEGLKNKAYLQAFYLGEIDSAIETLKFIIDYPGVNNELRDEAKLDLGDIYLLKKEPWESTLLYGQVDKSNKESDIGFSAKLRNAKLWYYSGDFNLAKSQLDVLKEATSRIISNDAMELSLLIQDNLVFDSTSVALIKFAKADLFIFRGQLDSAESIYKDIINKYPEDPIIDESHFQLGKVYKMSNRYELAMEQFDIIINDYSYDIKGDNALYEKGILLEEELKKPDEAIEIYLEFLKKYPASVYSTDVRRRLRNLRKEDQGLNLGLNENL
ncbi:tetratricopeptide repeat protein [Marinigracilibium pacificum]|uniref:Tetratricopeptide repeat protein n=1 Tax=Marinigracilibium pacificum TaxID=2729599 RepID=A0A848J193_9BACT|nr:tetratricopeptide repeat protein [Marinigracilibium pacificum]